MSPGDAVFTAFQSIHVWGVAHAVMSAVFPCYQPGWVGVEWSGQGFDVGFPALPDVLLKWIAACLVG